MDRRHDRFSSSRLTIGGMMRIAVFTAVALACVVPILRDREAGIQLSWLSQVAYLGAVVPVVLAALTFVLCRRGCLKDWLIRFLLLIAVMGTLAVLVHVERYRLDLWLRGRLPHDYPFLAMAVGIVILLGLIFLHLFRPLVPRWCPSCKLPTLLIDPANRVGIGSKRPKVYQCVACRDHRYSRGGSAREPVQSL